MSDDLEGLDFEPKCKCGGTPTHYLEIHAVDHCTPAKPTWIQLLCQECMLRNVDRVFNIVAWGTAWCSTCGAPLVSIGDIIVTSVPIDNAGQR